jgi:hypothetical protein
MDDDELIASLAGGDDVVTAACRAVIVLFATRPQRGLL